MTSNKKCAIVYTRKQEPNSSPKGEAERQRTEIISVMYHLQAHGSDLCRCCIRSGAWSQAVWIFPDHEPNRQKVNALHSLRNIKQAATNSVRFRQTRKERVPWAHWISRVAAIGSAVYTFKRVRTRTNEPSDHNNYDLHKLNRLVWWKTELLKDFAQQGCHITTE